MKIFKEIILVVFSLAILLVGITAILVALELINLNSSITYFIGFLVTNKILTIGVSLCLSLLALVGIFATTEKEEDVKAGLAIKHEAGTVYITKDTFESIVYNVTRSFASLKNVKVTVTISETGAYASIYTYIMPDTIVPTMTLKLQQEIKDAVLKQTTVEIKEANIKIKGVYTQIEKKV